MTEVEGLRVAVVVCVALIAALALGWWRATGWVGRANVRRQSVARAGEDEAERLLERLGFEVLERQVTGVWWMEVDGDPREVRCRADLLVRRKDRRFVAEVKTGDRAPSPTLPATRRQLLEYTLAFEVDGVLLLDMERRRVRVVRFPRFPDA
ncbi:MAG: hypothetical protein ABMA64_10415 [Myxococcota bacterium]